MIVFSIFNVLMVEWDVSNDAQVGYAPFCYHLRRVGEHIERCAR